MNYEDLRKFQRMERNAPHLAELDKKFYSELVELIKENRTNYEKSKSVEDLKILENIFKISRDIFERREQKIVLKSLRAVKTGEMEDERIIQMEKTLFDDLKKVLKQNRSDFESVMIGDSVASSAKETREVMANMEAVAGNGSPEDLNTVLVRILKNIPKFVSSDMQEYGPFTVSEMKKLPKKEAELLSRKQFVEII